MVEGPQPPPIKVVVTTLANELGSVGSDVLLVLDDFHVIDASDIQDQMSFLLEHLPPSAHVVIATRADPAFPLARLRAQGQLVEVRAADLRFTREEAAEYLNQAAGLDLDASQVAALEERTEGWIAALQLAALSMQGRDDVDGFIAGFTGDDRFVVDYLVEEVLDRQPEDVRRFLLWTCILDRLTGPCATRSRARMTVKPRSRTSIGGTCSWSRSTPAASGTDTTTYSRMSFGRACCARSRTASRTSTGARASGTSSAESGLRPFATHSTARTTSGPPT